MMSKQEIHQACAALRQLIALEDDLVELADRQVRVPTALAQLAGYPSGGSGEGSGSALNDAGKPSSITERLAVHSVSDDERQRQEPGWTPPETDPVGERVVSALFALSNMATAARTARRKITEAAKMSTLRKPLAHLAEVCAEEGCEDLAVAGGRGRCEADRKWLDRHPDERAVPRAVIARRNERRSRKPIHVDGPMAQDTDPIVERLVDDYDEAS